LWNYYINMSLKYLASLLINIHKIHDKNIIFLLMLVIITINITLWMYCICDKHG
jgi:hypothetical protein